MKNAVTAYSVWLIIPPKLIKETEILYFKWRVPLIGLGYISSYISQLGYQTEIFDLVVYPVKDFLRKLRETPPDVIGITGVTEDYYSIKKLLAVIKKINPNIITVLGGPHASGLPAQTLEEMDDLDFVIYGEGEVAFKELLDEVFGEQKYERVKSLVYRRKKEPDLNGKNININPENSDKAEEFEIVVNSPQPPITDLDALPFPAWDKYDLTKYTSFSERLLEHYIELPIITQRGCPFQCVFCQRVLGQRVRQRSIENIMQEIEYDYEHYKMQRLAIMDETFSLNKKRISSFCRALIKKGYNKKFTWSCFTRVNLIDEDLVKLMKLAGCRLINFGVESGNEFILKKIKKGIKLEDAARAVRLCKKYGIEVHYGIIYGHPFETIETLKDSLRFALKNRPDEITFAILVPFPGTEVREYCKTNYGGLKLIARDWLDYNKQMGRALELVQLPKRYLDLFQLYSYIRFYLHPKNIRNVFNLVNVKSIPLFIFKKIMGILKIK
ncbi:MAG: B12-binding domain-containing radical SAM protein [Promethearchaeota archaeon]